MLNKLYKWWPGLPYSLWWHYINAIKKWSSKIFFITFGGNIVHWLISLPFSLYNLIEELLASISVNNVMYLSLFTESSLTDLVLEALLFITTYKSTYILTYTSGFACSEKKTWITMMEYYDWDHILLILRTPF